MNDFLDKEDIIDIEEYSKKDKPVPTGKKYRIRIDKDLYVVHTSKMIGREILSLAGKIPVEQFRLYQKLKHGQSVDIGYDQTVDFTLPGVERFMTIPLDQTEGAK
jgi:hypothetical protein